MINHLKGSHWFISANNRAWLVSVQALVNLEKDGEIFYCEDCGEFHVNECHEIMTDEYAEEIDRLVNEAEIEATRNHDLQ